MARVTNMLRFAETSPACLQLEAQQLKENGMMIRYGTLPEKGL